MSERIYNTDKVFDQIGLKNEQQYDRIDVFVDIANKNNVWAIVYYTDYRKNKKISKKDIIKFANYNEMITFVRSNFNGYELNHQVDYLKRKIYLHDVDYINMDYYLHEGKPHLNYIELNYKEYVNGDYHIRKMSIARKYEKIFFDIIKNNEKSKSKEFSTKDLVNIIDVNNIRKDKHNTKMFDKKEEKNDVFIIPKIRSKRRETHIRNLKIAISVASLSVILASGYNLIKNKKPEPDIISQKNFSISARDISIHHNEGKAGLIIEKLMDNNYSNVFDDDLEYVVNYIKEVENSNYDKNNSLSLFNYTDYFGDRIIINHPEILNIKGAKHVLNMIETLYNSCFKTINGVTTINQRSAKKYLDYVLSLTFMYDTTVDIRSSGQVPMKTQSIASDYATKEEISEYNKYPLILKYIILNQLHSVLYHDDYTVTSKPSNYFKSLDKEALINEVKVQIESVFDQMKHNCNNNQKSM